MDKEEIEQLCIILDKVKYLKGPNAHVVDYLFWTFKKNKEWYWFPLKNNQRVLTTGSIT